MQVDVQNLVTLLSNGQADLSLFPTFYQDVMTTLGSDLWHTSAVPITLTEGDSDIVLPPNLLNLMTLIYDDTVLSQLDLRELESLNYGWRNVTGSPIAFTIESQTRKTAEVYPRPFETSPLIIPVHGLPVGEDYQPGNGIAIQSEIRPNELPYLTLPMALLILEREYVRESPHQDFAFGLLCGQLGKMLLKMLNGHETLQSSSEEA